MSRPPLNILLTVDTEFSAPTSDESVASWEIERDVYGMTDSGELGLRYQLDQLAGRELKASYFVESLFASVLGLGQLREIVDTIRAAGQEVQAHLQTGWLTQMPFTFLTGKRGANLTDFSYGEQRVLIAEAVKNLRACGVPGPRAFRAGNYGANFDTLRALKDNGILFDSSYNATYLKAGCNLGTDRVLSQPCDLGGIREYPVSFFRDLPGHYRHARLGACSFSELRNAITKAWERGWPSFVIVFHSHELIRRNPALHKRSTPDPIVVGRFLKLCDFLA